MLGIDDWAWRKGHRYGTILCDLERGKVVDLLPDRSAESTAEWLRAHPGTEIVSRDRASLYAQAATTAAPQAIQVADRWHLLHNLTEAFIGALVPHHRLLSETARALVISPAASSALPPAKADKPTPLVQAKQRLNREHRLAKYEAVMEQVRKGVTQHEIARSCGVGIRTIRRWIRAQVFPERRTAERRSKVDRHREYLEQRWNEDVTMPPNSGMSYAHEVLPANRLSSGVGFGATMAHDATAHGSRLPHPRRSLHPHGKQRGAS